MENVVIFVLHQCSCKERYVMVVVTLFYNIIIKIKHKLSRLRVRSLPQLEIQGVHLALEK
jgi:hypothetical protein